MNDAVAVHRIEREDFAQWKSLWGRYNAFYGRSGPTALPDEISAVTFSRFFDSYEPVYALVATSSEKLVGLAHLVLHRSTIDLNPVCYLQDLFTDEQMRGRGVGRALIEEVYRVAEGLGCTKVDWLTHETNSTAIRLYDQVAQRSGFIVYRRSLELRRASK
jgi:GNAT superfamily N-acetyltransferase